MNQKNIFNFFLVSFFLLFYTCLHIHSMPSIQNNLATLEQALQSLEIGLITLHDSLYDLKLDVTILASPTLQHDTMIKLGYDPKQELTKEKKTLAKSLRQSTNLFKLEPIPNETIMQYILRNAAAYNQLSNDELFKLLTLQIRLALEQIDETEYSENAINKAVKQIIQNATPTFNTKNGQNPLANILGRRKHIEETNTSSETQSNINATNITHLLNQPIAPLMPALKPLHLYHVQSKSHTQQRKAQALKTINQRKALEQQQQAEQQKQYQEDQQRLQEERERQAQADQEKQNEQENTIRTGITPTNDYLTCSYSAIDELIAEAQKQHKQPIELLVAWYKEQEAKILTERISPIEQEIAQKEAQLLANESLDEYFNRIIQTIKVVIPETNQGKSINKAVEQKTSANDFKELATIIHGILNKQDFKEGNEIILRRLQSDHSSISFNPSSKNKPFDEAIVFLLQKLAATTNNEKIKYACITNKQTQYSLKKTQLQQLYNELIQPVLNKITEMESKPAAEQPNTTQTKDTIATLKSTLQQEKDKIPSDIANNLNYLLIQLYKNKQAQPTALERDHIILAIQSNINTETISLSQEQERTCIYFNLYTQNTQATSTSAGRNDPEKKSSTQQGSFFQNTKKETLLDYCKNNANNENFGYELYKCGIKKFTDIEIIQKTVNTSKWDNNPREGYSNKISEDASEKLNKPKTSKQSTITEDTFKNTKQEYYATIDNDLSELTVVINSLNGDLLIKKNNMETAIQESDTALTKYKKTMFADNTAQEQAQTEIRNLKVTAAEKTYEYYTAVHALALKNREKIKLELKKDPVNDALNQKFTKLTSEINNAAAEKDNTYKNISLARTANYFNHQPVHNASPTQPIHTPQTVYDYCKPISNQITQLFLYNIGIPIEDISDTLEYIKSNSPFEQGPISMKLSSETKNILKIPWSQITQLNHTKEEYQQALQSYNATLKTNASKAGSDEDDNDDDWK